MVTVKEVAAMVDHTNLKAYATREDFQKLCNEAVHYGFKSVAINTYPVAMCREMLRGTNVLTGAAISFPLGQTPIATKVAEARNAVADGCQEFDYVLDGVLRIILGGNELILAPGDSVYYDSSLPHVMYAPEGDCRFIAVVVKTAADAELK